MPSATLPPLDPSYYQLARYSYTPGTYYVESWNQIKGTETGPEEVYTDVITQILLETDGQELGYASMLKARLPKGLTLERAEEIRSWAAFLHLDNHDYLPAFPAPADWAKYLGAPVAYATILFQHQRGNDIVKQLPTLEDGTLPAYFRNAVEKLYEEMAPHNNLPDFNVRMDKKAVRQRFTALVIGHKNALAGLPHPQLAQMIADAAKEFTPKLYQYRLALFNQKTGAFDEQLTEVKSRNLNKKDAVDFIVNSFLK